MSASEKLSADKISSNAMLVSFHAGVLTIAKKHHGATDAGAKAYGADPKKAGRFIANVIDPQYLKPVQAIVGEMRQEHLTRTVAWGDDGKRALGNVGYFDYTSRMQDLQTRFHNAVEDFISVYPQAVAEARQFRGQMFDSSEYFNDDDQLREQFYAKLDFAPMPLTDDFRRSLTGEALETVVGQHIEAFKEKIENSLLDVCERIKTAVSHCAERLRAYKIEEHEGGKTKVSGKFHDTLIENIQELAGLLPSLNITGSEKINELAEELPKLTQFSPDTLRGDEKLRNDVASEADRILKKLEGFF